MKVQEGLPVFYAKKSLGQNFLISEAIARKIAEASLVEGDCGAIEIGPAYGALTKELAPLFKKVVAIGIRANGSAGGHLIINNVGYK